MLKIFNKLVYAEICIQFFILVPNVLLAQHFSTNLLEIGKDLSLTASSLSPSIASSSSSSPSLSSSLLSKYDLVAIQNTKNFKLYDRKRKNLKPWYGENATRNFHCVRPATCQKIQNNTCFGTKLPYSYTSLDLTDSHDQYENHERLYNYQALKSVPKCWHVIQPFLCAVYAPKCEVIDKKDMVYLPSLSMCRETLKPCQIFYNSNIIPDFLKCTDTLFPSNCTNDIVSLKLFKQDGKCLPPLVDSTSSYGGIEMCSIQCKDPSFTDDEQQQIKKFISWGATICAICNLFVILTFIFDWKYANTYPSLIVFYLNFSSFISCLGWLAQFTVGSSEEIVCRRDGTLRHSEPIADENLSCVVVFILVYYFLMAAMVWFVILTYSWHIQTNGNVKTRINKMRSYFHLVAWSLPLVLTITILALSEVDGNSVVGICFVGYVNFSMRGVFLIGPMIMVILISGYFIVRGMILLLDAKKYIRGINSAIANKKLSCIMFRMGTCSFLIFTLIIITLVCQVYEFRNSSIWAESLKNYIICNISATITKDQNACTMENRPSLSMLQLQLLCVFGVGVVMSSWCWTLSSGEIWRRFIVTKLGGELEARKIQKHRLIARTWAKRQDYEENGNIIVTYKNTYTDPVGLNFNVNELHSNQTNELSTTWANYLPFMMRRRVAVANVVTSNSKYIARMQNCGGQTQKTDSEISFSLRTVSVESRRNSTDSQVSVKIAEMQGTVARRACCPDQQQQQPDHPPTGNSNHPPTGRSNHPPTSTGQQSHNQSQHHSRAITRASRFSRTRKANKSHQPNKHGRPQQHRSQRAYFSDVEVIKYNRRDDSVSSIESHFSAVAATTRNTSKVGFLNNNNNCQAPNNTNNTNNVNYNIPRNIDQLNSFLNDIVTQKPIKDKTASATAHNETNVKKMLPVFQNHHLSLSEPSLASASHIKAGEPIPATGTALLSSTSSSSSSISLSSSSDCNDDDDDEKKIDKDINEFLNQHSAKRNKKQERITNFINKFGRQNKSSIESSTTLFELEKYDINPKVNGNGNENVIPKTLNKNRTDNLTPIKNRNRKKGTNSNTLNKPITTETLLSEAAAALTSANNKNYKKNKDIENNNNEYQLSSDMSFDDLDLRITNNNQSSFSGVSSFSSNGTGKRQTHSRNSKLSSDIGTQTSDYEIVSQANERISPNQNQQKQQYSGSPTEQTQTTKSNSNNAKALPTKGKSSSMALVHINNNKNKNTNNNNGNNNDDDEETVEYTEKHKLLYKKKRPPTTIAPPVSLITETTTAAAAKAPKSMVKYEPIYKNKDYDFMSESKKIKLLLLPSPSSALRTPTSVLK